MIGRSHEFFARWGCEVFGNYACLAVNGKPEFVARFGNPEDDPSLCELPDGFTPEVIAEVELDAMRVELLLHDLRADNERTGGTPA